VLFARNIRAPYWQNHWQQWWDAEQLENPLTSAKFLTPIGTTCRSCEAKKTNKSSAVAEMGDRLATIDMGRKVGVLLCPFRRRGCSPSNKMAPWSMKPFGHNIHGPKIGGCAHLGRVAGSPLNTMWPGTRPTSLPSFVVIHPTVRPQYTNVTDRPDRQTVR